jgi:sigma-E factor negative regulatory protein RseC
MSQIIEHSGIVQNIDGKHIRVQIVQESACSSCHAKGTCTAADMKDKYVDVEANTMDFKPGDAVMLYGQSSMGLLAVLLAFVMPFILILITLFVLKSQTDNETLSGAIALAVLIPYFIILSFFNQKLKAKLKFQIRRKAD